MSSCALVGKMFNLCCQGALNVPLQISCINFQSSITKKRFHSVAEKKFFYGEIRPKSRRGTYLGRWCFFPLKPNEITEDCFLSNQMIPLFNHKRNCWITSDCFKTETAKPPRKLINSWGSMDVPFTSVLDGYTNVFWWEKQQTQPQPCHLVSQEKLLKSNYSFP